MSEPADREPDRPHDGRRAAVPEGVAEPVALLEVPRAIGVARRGDTSGVFDHGRRYQAVPEPERGPACSKVDVFVIEEPAGVEGPGRLDEPAREHHRAAREAV